MSKMVETVKRVQAWQQSNAGRRAARGSSLRRAGSGVPGPHFRLDAAPLAPNAAPPVAPAETPALPRRDLRIDRTAPQESAASLVEPAHHASGRARIELLPREELDGTFRKIHGQYDYATPICMAFTSPSGEDGKTTLVINLALAAGRVPGAHVLVVDGNLRQPRVSDQLGIRPPIGLTDVVVEGIAPVEVIRPSPFAAFDILPAGRPMRDAQAILGSRRMGTLVWELKRQYSVILIDTAQITKYADAGLLGPICDGVYVVARLHHTRRESLHRAVQLLKAAGSHVRGCIATAAGEP
jgi:Mrp family chromosome partitioning ATPase